MTTDMDDGKLIELVSVFPVMYDFSHPKYMDSTLKANIWNKIGEEMKTDSITCKTRWNNIRDNYRKSLKKAATKRGIAKKIKQYKYSEQLGFIKEYLVENETKGGSLLQADNIADTPTKQEVEEVVADEPMNPIAPKRNFEDNLTENQLEFFKMRKKTATVRKEAAQQASPGKILEYILKRNDETTPAINAVDPFIASIVPTLKSLTPYYLNLAKSEIFASVQKYEMKMLMEQHSHDICYSNLQSMTPQSSHIAVVTSGSHSFPLSPATSASNAFSQDSLHDQTDPQNDTE